MNTGEKVIKAFIKQLVCPVCSDDEVIQPMMQYGDFPEAMFCPHCDLSVQFSEPILTGYMGENEDKQIKYIDSRVSKFLSQE